LSHSQSIIPVQTGEFGTRFPGRHALPAGHRRQKQCCSAIAGIPASYKLSGTSGL
jgi:hypothetical protein